MHGSPTHARSWLVLIDSTHSRCQQDETEGPREAGRLGPKAYGVADSWVPDLAGQTFGQGGKGIGPVGVIGVMRHAGYRVPRPARRVQVMVSESVLCSRCVQV